MDHDYLRQIAAKEMARDNLRQIAMFGDREISPQPGEATGNIGSGT
jgi:hypothetical protein